MAKLVYLMLVAAFAHMAIANQEDTREGDPGLHRDRRHQVNGPLVVASAATFSSLVDTSPGLLLSGQTLVQGYRNTTSPNQDDVVSLTAEQVLAGYVFDATFSNTGIVIQLPAPAEYTAALSAMGITSPVAGLRFPTLILVSRSASSQNVTVQAPTQSPAAIKTASGLSATYNLVLGTLVEFTPVLSNAGTGAMVYYVKALA